ncbi:MAG: hypothetical protein ACK5ZQ_08590, partial [bacterium]
RTRSPPRSMRHGQNAGRGKLHQPARVRVRIVLDTNVVLSALLWRGTPYRLLATIGQRSSIQL